MSKQFLDEKFYERAAKITKSMGLKPRPVERIAYITSVLTALWQTYPDMRLGQLIENALFLKLGRNVDLFNVEDDVMMEALCAFLGREEKASKSSTSEEGEEVLL